MTIARDVPELRSFAQDVLQGCGFAVEPMRVDEQQDWAWRDGVLSHRSGGFFHVLGYERPGHPQELVLYQPQNAITGLAIHRSGGATYLLLQVRVEPGNTRATTLGPTVQSTAANYHRLHGGRATTHIDLFLSYHPRANPLANSTQFDLGRKYIQKTKTVSVVELDAMIAPGPSMIWVELGTVLRAIREDYLINTDLRALLPTFDWLRFRDNDTLSPAPRPTSWAGETVPRQPLGRVVPVNTLADWRVDDHGVADVGNRGVSVRQYAVQISDRERAAWSQPLMHAETVGLTVLCIRRRSGGEEYLVSIEADFGVSGGRSINPSYVRYPGESASADAEARYQGTVIEEVRHSEEGGRFFHNDIIYRVVQVDGDLATEPHQRWIDRATLRSILLTSNQVGIHLRSFGALLLESLYPHLA